jgi:arylsulfatase
MFGNRGIYHKGWTAVTKHSTPWDLTGANPIPFDDDVWELYDTTKDWSQANDLSQENPQKLHELQRLWLIEATKYKVLPIDDRKAPRMNSDMAGRPVLIRGDSQMFFGGMGRLSENSVVNVKNKSYSVTADIVSPDKVHGTIIAQGGAFGGWTVYAKDGTLKYCYNLLGLQQYSVESTEKIPAGQHQVRAEFAYDGGGLGKGGAVSLYIDGKKVGEGRVEATQPIIFSCDETTDIGSDTGTAVTTEFTSHESEFTGKVNWVQIDLGKDDHDHLISPEERLRLAMGRQ